MRAIATAGDVVSFVHRETLGRLGYVPCADGGWSLLWVDASALSGQGDALSYTLWEIEKIVASVGGPIFGRRVPPASHRLLHAACCMPAARSQGFGALPSPFDRVLPFRAERGRDPLAPCRSATALFG